MPVHAPILGVKPIQAGTIIAAVGIRHLGLVQIEPQSRQAGPFGSSLKILLRLARAIPHPRFGDPLEVL